MWIFYLEHDTITKKNESNIRLQVYDCFWYKYHQANQLAYVFVSSWHFNIVLIGENFLLLSTVLEIFIDNKDHLLVNYPCSMDEIHCRFWYMNWVEQLEGFDFAWNENRETDDNEECHIRLERLHASFRNLFVGNQSLAL